MERPRIPAENSLARNRRNIPCSLPSIPVFPGCTIFAAGSTNGVLQVWDISRRLLRRQWSDTAGDVWPGVFLAGGNKLVTISIADRSHREWDLASGLQIQSWRWPAEFS